MTQRDHEQIGPYHLLEQIGEGGMGAVYVAEQREPLQRRVALKLIKVGMDTRQVLARFDAERQALARMEHPAIAKILDAGATEQGKPYFVMELVRGPSLTRYCDEKRLCLKERIQLFADVCAGVQHAHSKGVLHRDLKPGNILVQESEGRAQPKIIDFGLARATDQKLTELSLFTETGQLIGTPEYMSPEQAGFGGLDVDTRSDVYSLGVILFELLTGDLPLGKGRLREGGPLEMQRLIREEDPGRPSTRISKLGQASDEIASLRATDVKALRAQLRKDLDWIVLKALEKDRERRYSTPAALALDLEKLLNGDPVDAHPPSAGYKLQKFVAKNRGATIGAASVVVALMIGLSAALWQYQIAQQRAEEARENERIAQENAREADENRKLAERKEQEAQEYARKAERSAKEAQANLESFKRMADIRVYQKLLQREQSELWPLAPSRAEAMESWLKDAKKLASRLPGHERTLAQAQEQRAKLNSSASEETSDPQADPQEKAVEDQVALDWQAAELQKLIGNVEKLQHPEHGRIASVERRWERARAIETAFESDQALWEQAIAAIRAADGKSASSLYSGTELRAVVGLRPLGPDPVSKLWEFAHLPSGNAPERDRETGRLRLRADSGVVLVFLPGGPMRMGAQNVDPNAPYYDPAAENDESLSTREIPKLSLAPFFISKYEMTQEQWLRVMGQNPSQIQTRRDMEGRLLLHPVEQVDFPMSMEAMRRLGLQLPTEAQWEYAARAGTKTPWWTGDTKESLRGAANIMDKSYVDAGGENAAVAESWLSDGWALHAPVHILRPNPFGLHHVIGNVSEWCLDAAVDYDRPPDPRTGLRTQDGRPGRQTRGGDWGSVLAAARVSVRFPLQEHSEGGTLGLRPVLNVTW
jgi:formylglycine-generating enzyme required for sulfatase activity